MKPFLGTDELFTRSKEIVSQFPITFGDYYEPFLRNGSIFFNLFNHKRVFGKAFLSSQDKDIVKAFNAVKDQPERVKKVLATCCAKDSQAFYEAMTKQMSNPSVCIYCYRAGYPDRETQAKLRWQKSMTQDVSCIDECSTYLNRWAGDITSLHWEESLMRVKDRDVVFCDPQDFGCGPNGFLDDRYKWLESFLRGLKSRNCHIYLMKDGNVRLL